MKTESNSELSQVISNHLFLTDLYLSNRYGVTRQTIWRWSRDNSGFPKPIKLSPGCTRWKLSEVERWEATQNEGI